MEVREASDTETVPARARMRVRDSATAAFRLAWRASPRELGIVAAISLVEALVPPAVVLLGKHLVDLVVARAPMARAVPTIVALGLLAGGQRALGRFQSHREDVLGTVVHHHAERRFLERVSRVDLGHFDDPGWHDRVSRAKRDVGWRPYQLTWTIVGLGSYSVTIAGMLAVLASMDPMLVVLSVASIVPAQVLQRRINRRLYDFWYELTPEQREHEYLGELLSEPRTAKEVRSFTLAPYLLGRHGAIASGQLARLRLLYRAADRFTVVAGLLSGGALAAAYALGVARALAGDLTPGDLTAVTGAFVSVTGQAAAIVGAFLQLDQHAQFLRDYFEFLEVEPLLPVRAEPVALPARLERGIELDAVDFTYPGGTEPALRGITLAIRPGEMVALVGDNGAGKTTLAKLLLRFYDPTSGAVRLGGVDLRDTDPDELRRRVGVLFQDFAQYELSLRENVVLGRVEREPTDDEVLDALRAARADWLAKRLAKGLDSKVGRLFEGGHDLSGGEWQRLALARLIFRDADVWILDEPTASLDPEAEAGIFAELRETLHGKIGVVISHRFSTVRIADRIVVLEDGAITEVGTHGELVARGGRYAHLFELQAAGYR